MWKCPMSFNFQIFVILLRLMFLKLKSDKGQKSKLSHINHQMSFYTQSYKLTIISVPVMRNPFQVAIYGSPIDSPNNTGYCRCLSVVGGKSLLLKAPCISFTRLGGFDPALTGKPPPEDQFSLYWMAVRKLPRERNSEESYPAMMPTNHTNGQSGN